LLAGAADEGLEALVGDEEFLQVVRGEVTADALRTLIEDATRQSRLVTLGKAANDASADVDEPAFGRPASPTTPSSKVIAANDGGPDLAQETATAASADRVPDGVNILVLTRDDEFLATIRDSVQGLHNIVEAATVRQASRALSRGTTGVVIVDAGIAGSKVEKILTQLCNTAPRLAGIVAGRRDDGEMLMDLINRGKVYRFLMKPVSPGRSRLAIEAAIKHHLEAPDPSLQSESSSAANTGAADTSAVIAETTQSEPAAAEAVVDASPQAPSEPRNKAGRRADGRSEPSVTAVKADYERRPDSEDPGLSNTAAGRTPAAGDGPAVDTDPSTSSTVRTAANKKPVSRKIMGIAAAMGFAAAASAWLFMDLNDRASVPAQAVVGGMPVITEAEFGAGGTGFDGPDISNLLKDAQLAVESGRVFSPPGENAIELLLSALELAPGDAATQRALQDAISTTLGAAEVALLEGQPEDAALALRQVTLADPDNQRLPFLGAQLSQIQARNLLDEARMAIRESRFEDANRHIEDARALGVGDDSAIAAATEELNAAINAQQTDELLAKAQSRLAQDRLIAPSNDNARYYYEMALSVDADNAAAKQGLATIANKLVLRARLEIDRGEFKLAGNLLADARVLAPSSTEIDAADRLLKAAKDRVAQQRREAAERLVAERVAAEKAAAERLAVERAAAEAAVAAEAAAEPAVAEPPSADSPVAAKILVAESTVADSPVAAGPRVADSTAAEPPVAEPPLAEPSIAEPPTGKLAETVAMTDSVVGDKVAAATPAADEAQPDQAGTVASPALVPISSLNRIKYVAPKYPRSAQRRGITGDGSVTDVSVRKSEPGDTFVASAMKAVEGWEFEPVVEDGMPVRKVAGVRMMFAME
jgi:outer membrane biosynthesis protein TonB/DNA-binding NarL/FixJ family response regulator